MDYDEFITLVQEKAGLAERGTAERAAQVTLATLGERIYRTEREHLAAQLPKELQVHLFTYASGETTRRDTDRYHLEEFYNRLTARAGIGYPHAIRQAQAVFAALQAAVTPPVLEQIFAQLPNEYKNLLP
jgi:uncharacterized protein (DUF2267 family)